MKFCLVDISNLVHRAKHAVPKKSMGRAPYDPFGEDVPQDNPDDLYVGLILTVVFNGLLNAFQKSGSDHCVAAFDSRSWRRDFMEEYKANRRDRVRTPKEQHDHEIINRIIDELRDFLKEFTNVTVLEAPGVEADDFIARWIHHHDSPEFEHVIVSADGDFKQLVDDRVNLYNPMSKMIYTLDGILYKDAKKKKKDEPIVEYWGETWKLKTKKNSNEPELFDPEWELFEKCIRGDSSDNIRAAWPGVRTTKMRKAFHGSVEEWNNFINSTWGEDENKHSVRELYERNRTLIDLTRQPDEIKEVIDETIADALEEEPNRMVGAYFAKFCAKYSLNKLSQRSEQFTDLLSRRYA